MIDVEKIRKDFPILKRKMQGHDLIYFDNAATTFKPQCVIDAVVHYYTELGANAHRGDYELSYLVDSEYEGTRKAVAGFIGADEKEIVFTSGASASLNQIAYGYSRFLKQGDVILSCEAEHASSILPWMRVAEEKGCIIKYIELDEEGRLSIDSLKQLLLDGKVKVVALAHVTNVLGYEAPMKEICALAHQAGAIVVMDMAQSAPHMKINVKDIDCDFAGFSAHKMCGPTGLGVMYGKYELLSEMEPYMLGGGSNARFDMCGNLLLKEAPYKYETGTPPIEAVIGFKAALQYLDQIGMDEIHAYEKELHEYAIEKLSKLDNITLYNPHADACIITFNVKDVFAQDAATFFNSQGVAVRAGHHCAKLLTQKLQTSATLRASCTFYNTKEEVDRFVDICSQASIENCLGVFF
ncbi:aminotransferase class V-fold PLP-dependent enzyme [uncultured Traorella sp.]|uniref:aminotransferase class V-fold PLP-dependent enzyme n=1 Tax=uncultured Traorella sp. TaxID=1929048 RepID=UPI0025E2F6AD|nr:aminotransferase class V-fold PLP-dependent enzyme [uncultured Traorella sp.]